LEAALLVADAPLSARKLAQVAALADAAEVRELVDQLNTLLDRSEATFRVERVSSGYRLLTLPVFAAWLDRLHHRQAHLRLSPPMLETLAIVAYRQPVTRADLEAIRGVQCAEILKQLMERGLVKIVGEHDSLGRPYLYGTTRQFLELYGLTSLEELPMADTLRRTAPDSRAVLPGETSDPLEPGREAA
jgi:segregation and condensation protein B